MLKMSNAFQLVMPSLADGTRPNITTQGVQITPGNNTYPAYAEIMSDTLVTADAYLIDICFNSSAVSTQNRDTIVTIGFDFAGGTTYTDMEINHLLASCAQVLGGGATGIWYRFPIRIPAGTSIAAKASVNNATVGNISVYCILYGKPSRPELVRAGTFVRTYGATTATSQGTVITPGGVSEGAYTDLGTLADDIWAWEFGYGVDDTTIVSQLLFVDIGVGSTQKVVLANGIVCSATNESVNKPIALSYGDAKSGEHVYGRAQSSGAADTNVSLMAYGVGG